MQVWVRGREESLLTSYEISKSKDMTSPQKSVLLESGGAVDGLKLCEGLGFALQEANGPTGAKITWAEGCQWASGGPCQGGNLGLVLH